MITQFTGSGAQEPQQVSVGVVVVHGNGPRVGNILIPQAAAEASVAPMPVDVAGAMSQGQIRYLLVQTLESHLRRLRRSTPVACIVTETVADETHPGFADPAKPAGPFYDETRARQLVIRSGCATKEDAGRGWRQVVPSREPVEHTCRSNGGKHVPKSHAGSFFE